MSDKDNEEQAKGEGGDAKMLQVLLTAGRLNVCLRLDSFY